MNIRYRNLESTNKKLKSEIENYQKTIERMKKSKIRGAKGATGMTSSRPISRQSIKELKETKKHYQILEMVKVKITPNSPLEQADKGEEPDCQIPEGDSKSQIEIEIFECSRG